MTRITPQVRVEPNVTPMIDVMLVLLIIFMVVGPTLVDGFRAVPPEARFANRHPDSPGEVVLGVDAQGQLYLDRLPMDSATVRRRLVTRFRESPDGITPVCPGDTRVSRRFTEQASLAARVTICPASCRSAW
jgi:biopolymer transport protein ExbD